MNHMIVSALIHGVIYDVIWKAMRGMGLPTSIAIAAGVVVAALLFTRLFRQR